MKLKNYQILIIFVFFSCFNLNAQRIKTENVLKIADSILSVNTNSGIFKYFEGYNGSYQKYKKGEFYSHLGFTHKKKLNKKVEEIWVLYHFNFPEVDGLTDGA